MSQNQQSSDNQAGALFFMVPVILVAGVFSIFGWFAARAGASYRWTHALLFPVTWLLAQVSAAVLFICFGWVIALFCGSSDMANYVVGKTSELALLSSMFGDPLTIPMWHIVVYQIFVWVFFLRPIGQGLTTGVFDSAIVSAALADGVHPYHRRQQKLDTDSGFANSVAFYSKYKKTPQLGLLLVFMSSCPVDEYYT